jgi:hypothetical protein
MTKYIWLFLSFKRMILDEDVQNLYCLTLPPQKKVAQRVGYRDYWCTYMDDSSSHKR